MMQFPLALGMPQGFEWLIIAAVGLLIFGKRLPEVGRSLGRGIVEFKKGLKGVEEEVEQASSQPAKPADQPRPQITQQTQTAPQYKFDPYTGKPIEQSSSSTERVG
jgi:sec-independent protein translocase protein TatA